MSHRIDINRILRDEPRSSPRGAPMGHRSRHDTTGGPLYLQRIRFVDGDYGADGTYWGGGPGNRNLWCAFNGHGVGILVAGPSRIYVRAPSRALAKEAVLEDFPAATFHKE